MLPLANILSYQWKYAGIFKCHFEKRIKEITFIAHGGRKVFCGVVQNGRGCHISCYCHPKQNILTSTVERYRI